jgi:hypothetical protein
VLTAAGLVRAPARRVAAHAHALEDHGAAPAHFMLRTEDEMHRNVGESQSLIRF